VKSNTVSKFNATSPSASEARAIFDGYLVACFSVAVALIMLPFLGGPLQIEGASLSIALFFSVVISVGVTFLIALVVSLPGFVVLRFGLHWFKRSDLFSFVLAGVVNACLVMNVFLSSAKLSFSNIINSLQDPMALVFIFGGGGLAGLTSWAWERQTAQEADTKILEAENL
jgi:hypothetical protein